MRQPHLWRSLAAAARLRAVAHALAVVACSGSGPEPLFDEAPPQADASVALDSGGNGGTNGDAGSDGASRPGAGGRGAAGGGGAEPAPCVNSLDCPEPLVCDPSDGICVPCTRDADCSSDERCLGRVCRRECASDNACTPMGQLCAFDRGLCVDCLEHADCPEPEHCSDGVCAPDVCVPGTFCDEGAVAHCDPAGSAVVRREPCNARETCVGGAGAASCEPWVCTAGATECADDDLLSCSSDGLSVLSRVDCAGQGLHCVVDACVDRICAPMEPFCQDGAVRLCNDHGTASTVDEICGATEYCDALDAACRPQVCTPNQLSCDGPTQVRACNAEASGYEGAGTPCAEDTSCYQGECVSGILDEVSLAATLRVATDSAHLNFYRADAARRLRLIEVHVHVPTVPTDFVFLVYESATQTGTYTLISETAAVAGASGSGYVASPALDLPLVSGRFYLIGYGALGVQSYTETDITTGEEATSFGARISANNWSPPHAAATATWFEVDFAYRQRLTTLPP